MSDRSKKMQNFWDDAEIISAYSRADAIREGILVDVSPVAREAGITVPTALTQALHADCVAWNEENSAHQVEAGRLWDVLSMTRFTITKSHDSDRATVTVLRIPNTPQASDPEPADFIAHIGPGDTGEPVLTLMLPYED